MGSVGNIGKMGGVGNANSQVKFGLKEITQAISQATLDGQPSAFFSANNIPFIVINSSHHNLDKKQTNQVDNLKYGVTSK